MSKKISIVFVLLFIVFFAIDAEEMDLHNNKSNLEQFKTLSAEEQYNSVMNSFRDYMGIDKIIIWVYQMAEQYGREILPYMNKTLMNADLSKPDIDNTLEIHSYIFDALMSDDLLTEYERQLYIIVIKGKIKEYILKYRVIDGTVRMGYAILSDLNYEIPEEEYLYTEIQKAYWEKELGITGIVAGNMDTVFDVTPSPLAEYITD